MFLARDEIARTNDTDGDNNGPNKNRNKTNALLICLLYTCHQLVETFFFHLSLCVLSKNGLERQEPGIPPVAEGRLPVAFPTSRYSVA